MYSNVFKRWLDVVFALAALCVLSPLLAVVVLIIRLQDGGPAIFRQTRVGKDGSPFTIYKFRSMPVGTAHVPSASAATLNVTAFGRVLRRTNIDELPQLWNILNGDMSLIGPRPALSSQERLLVMRREKGVMALRPGLTGLAQVNSYDGMPDNEKVEWERRYAQDLSLSCDFSIVLKTFTYLLKRPPTY